MENQEDLEISDVIFKEMIEPHADLCATILTVVSELILFIFIVKSLQGKEPGSSRNTYIPAIFY